jgi:nitroimidazol reductase NimA-like FMN-containing flavoprotein (pyridoxamine 5'-phosphate oxidase superfamily)
MEGPEEGSQEGPKEGPKEWPIRQAKDALDEALAWQMLAGGDWGVLSTVGADGWPFGVPLSYVVLDKFLYVHGASVGHRMENIGHNPCVSFCVVASTTLRPGEVDRDYESVIAFGRAKVIVGPEKQRVMEAFLEKYCAPVQEATRQYLTREIDRAFVVRIAIEQLTGKKHKAGPLAPVNS